MILGVVQVRMGSTRLKKKALKTIFGKPVLALLINRMQYAKELDKIVIATTKNDEDKVILAFAKEEGLEAYAGSELDIVDRMYQTAKKFGADAIVRITGDCPLVDPKLVDEIVGIFREDPSLDYISNIYPPTYPDGLDVELITFKTLEYLWHNVKDEFLREWMAGFIIKNPDKFNIFNKENKEDLSLLRWTLDYEEDFIFLSKVFQELSPNSEMFYMDDVLNLLRKKPELMEINVGHIRNEAYLNKEAYKEAMDKIQMFGGVRSA